MSHNTALQDDRFRRLRETYETAFRELSRQVQHLQELASSSASGSPAVIEAVGRVEEARSAYRQSRDELAAFVMAASPETASHPSPAVAKARAATAQAGGAFDSNEYRPDPRAQVEHMAYLLWEKAGRPAGNAEEHWYQAERLILKRP